MPGLAEETGRRADEHERAVSALRDRAQEAARGEERRRQVRAQRPVPARERQLPHRHVLRRPDAGDGCAHVEPSGLLEHRVDLRLVREVGLRELTARLRRDRLRALVAAMVVNDHVRAFRRELSSARGADSARAAGHEHALSR